MADQNVLTDKKLKFVDRGTVEPPKFRLPMKFSDGTGGRQMRPEFAGKSTLELIKEGNRTATSRDRSKSYNQQDIQVGDIIEFYDNAGDTVRVRVTKAPTSLKNTTAEEWSKKEGWDPSMFENLRNKNYDQFEFKLLKKPAMRSAEVAVSQQFLEEKLNLTLPVGEIDATTRRRLKKELTMLGYRIPTQGKNSALPLLITRVLPREQGSTIMVPAEITVQMGSDFDIDKMFVMSRSVNKDGHSIAYTKEHREARKARLEEERQAELKKGEKTPEEINLKYDKLVSKVETLNEDQLNNKILDIYLSVLTSDQHAGELIAPLTSKPLADQLDRAHYEVKRSGDHVNSLHTNMYQEYINKFAKAAVGITATYITGKTLYGRAGVRLMVSNLIDPTGKGIIENSEYGYSLGNKYASDGVTLIADNLKVWNNAALDNAKDPILGKLGVDENTINSALLMTSLGYTLDTTIDFINQPIVQQIARYMALNPMTSYAVAKEKVLDRYEALRSVYNELQDSEGYAMDPTGTQTIDLTPDRLEGAVNMPLNVMNSEELTQQAQVLQLFDETYDAGRDLAKVNKVLSPETAKNLSKFSAIEEFRNIAQYVTDRSDWIRLDRNVFMSDEATPTDRIQNSPVPRVTAFFERGLRAAESFSKTFFPNNTQAYTNVKALIAELIGARDGYLSREQTDLVNARLGYLILTGNNKLREALLDGVDVKELLYSAENSLADRLTELKKDEKAKMNPLLRMLTPGDFNKKSLVKKINYNNTSDTSVSQENRISRAWLSLIENEDNAELRQFGKDLVAYAVLTAGFRMDAGSFFHLIPSKYWVDSGLEKAWNDNKVMLEEADALLDSAEVVIRQSPDLVGTLPNPIDPRNKDVFLTRRGKIKVETTDFKYDGNVIMQGNNQPNLKVTKLVIPTTPGYTEIKVPGQKNKLKKFIKVYNNVTIRGRNRTYPSRKMSGFRLYKLTGVDKKGKTATYEEIQWLGEKYSLVEGIINQPDKASIHPKNTAGTPANIPVNYDKLNYQLDIGERTPFENAEIEQKLKNFLNSIGVKIEAIDSLKEKFGLDANGVADLTNSIVYILNTQKGLDALPEETAHFFVEGLADHNLLERLLERVDETPEWQEVLENYSELYNNDERKLRKEAAAKVIGRYLIKSEPAPKNWIRRLMTQIKDLINRVFKGRDPFREAANYILTANNQVMKSAPTSAGVMYSIDLEGFNEYKYGITLKDGTVKYFATKAEMDAYKGKAKGEQVPEDLGKEARGETKDVALEKEIDLDAVKGSTKYREFDLSEAALDNLVKTFDEQAPKIAKVLTKLRQGLKSKLKRLELVGEE
ncbi:MAG: ASCH domain-containing protein [Candidatus Aenigmatarchaeota archaeon]|nr:MAG: ASCH domain-containing protein [Candidatus Aenigmarchaeota archaeon]